MLPGWSRWITTKLQQGTLPLFSCLDARASLTEFGNHPTNVLAQQLLTWLRFYCQALLLNIPNSLAFIDVRCYKAEGTALKFFPDGAARDRQTLERFRRLPGQGLCKCAPTASPSSMLSPRADPLRSDARLQQLLQRVKLSR